MTMSVDISSTHSRPEMVRTTRHGEAVHVTVNLSDGGEVNLFFDIATFEEIHSCVMWEAQREPFNGDHSSYQSTEHLVASR